MKPLIAIVVMDYDTTSAVSSSCRNQMLSLKNDYRILLLTNHSKPPEPDPSLEEGTKIIRFWAPSLSFLFRFSHVPRQIVFITFSLVMLLLQHRKQRLDLVVMHSHPITALLANPLKRKGIRTAMVMHGDIFDRPGNTYDSRLTLWYKFTTPKAYAHCTGVLALSPYMASLAHRGGAPVDRVHLTPNGVDPEEIGLSPTDFSEPNIISPKNLFIGRIEYNKGPDLLVEAFCRLINRWPNLELHCIGAPVSPRFERRLLAQLRDHGVRILTAHTKEAQTGAKVRFTPFVPRKALGSQYIDSAIVVVPSRSETLSTVTMEAMAAGRVVVASDTGGNPMLIDNAVTGLLFRNGDAHSLAKSFTDLLSSPEKIIHM